MLFLVKLEFKRAEDHSLSVANAAYHWVPIAVLAEQPTAESMSRRQ